MNYPLSDDSADSDVGIRFKTTNIRGENDLPFNFDINNSISNNPNNKRINTEEKRSRKKKKNKRHKKHKEKSHSKKNYKDKEDTLTESEDSGPSLPANREKIKETHETSSCLSASEISEEEHFGPLLPPKIKEKKDDDKMSQDNSYGPILPPSIKSNKIEIECNKKNMNNESELIGPVLPPHLKSVSENKSNILDSLPSKIIDSENEKSEEKNIIGPMIPDHIKSSFLENTEEIQSEEDEEIIGPLPDSNKITNSQRKLEERALEIKLGMYKKSDTETVTREEWMTELPEVGSAKLGLGPRKFRPNETPDMSDRTSWTDTPKEKSAKSSKQPDLKTTAEIERLKEKDLIHEKLVEEHKKKKKRDKSLIDMHQTKMKKMKEENPSQKERRPFSRDIDLKVNRFDDAQTKAIIKKAQLLDNRFSSGQSKFL